MEDWNNREYYGTSFEDNENVFKKMVLMIVQFCICYIKTPEVGGLCGT